MLGTFLTVTAMLSSHFPSALMRNIEPSILHFMSEVLGIGSFDFQMTPPGDSEIFPKETVPPELRIRSASYRSRGLTAAKASRTISSTSRILELIAIL